MCIVLCCASLCCTTLCFFLFQPVWSWGSGHRWHTDKTKDSLSKLLTVQPAKEVKELQEALFGQKELLFLQTTASVIAGIVGCSAWVIAFSQESPGWCQHVLQLENHLLTPIFSCKHSCTLLSACVPTLH